MAQIDTSIYGNLIGAPKSLADNLAGLDAADLQRTQLAGAKVNLIGQQQSLADQQAVRALYQRPGFDPLKNDADMQAFSAASPTQALAMRKAALENAQTQATIGHLGAQTNQANAAAQTSQFDLARKKVEAATGIVTSAATPADAHAKFQQAVAQGLMTPEEAAQKEQEVPTDPAGFNNWKQSSALALLTASQKIDAAQKAAQLTETTRHNQADETNTVRGQNMTAQTARQNNAANIAKDYTIAGIDPANPSGVSAGALSPAAVENAAARYNVDGTLPPMAMGPRGAVGRTAIMNRAAELSLGVDPTQLRVNQLDAKSAGSALTQLSKAKTMSAAFEDTANQNAQLALGLSGKMDRTGVPLLNAGLQAIRTGTGSPEATQFAAANETFVNEYAKIMSGGMGNGPVSDAARSKASKLLTTSMTPQQYAGNVKLLQTEMSNRMKGFDDQEAALRARLGGKSQSAATPAGAPDVPDDIAAILKKHGG